MALAGLIMGYVSIAFIPIVLIIAAIAIPGLLRNLEVRQESKAVSSLRTIQTAESAYHTLSSGKYGGIPDLIDRGVLSSDYRSRVSGYEFTILADDRGYTATASPATVNQGRYAYTMMSDGIVRYSTDSKLAPDGEVGQEVR
jgi:type II secretory pathway pseudopilin PulG